MKNNLIKSIIITSCILLQSMFALSQCVNFNVDTELVFGEVKTKLQVENFNEVEGFGVQLNWDSEVVRLKNYQFNVGEGPELSINETEDWIRFLFVGNPLEPAINILDGESVLDAYFEIIGAGDPAISIGDDFYPTEVVISGEGACITTSTSQSFIDGGHLFGSVVKDVDQDCNINNDDSLLSGWIVKIANEDREIYRTTNELGEYTALLPIGDYQVSVQAPNHIWEMCQEAYDISVLTIDDEIEQSFLAQAVIDCSFMLVDINTPRLRRCFENTYFVEWYNQGSVVGENASVVVQLDDNLDYMSSSATNVSYSESSHSLTVELGDVASFESGKFTIKVVVNCDYTVLGQTHCTTANVYPQDACSVDPDWSGAQLSIEGVCEGDSIRFIIANIGNGDMDQPASFIVVEDQVMRPAEEIKLDAQEEFEIAFEANGSTYRIILEQPSDYPYEEMISQAIEACGVNNEGTFSIGFITMFSEFDANPFYDVHCMENIGSYDPNDKQAWPKGYQDTDLIENYVGLDYMIRFQNTGSDTAFTVVVTDQISEYLDMNTLRVGSASHDYTYSIADDRTLVFRFDNILLPDSTTNEEASNGFITFTIQQNEGNPDGTLIDNIADIYFDFNDPIQTNLVRREVGSNFVNVILSNENLLSDIYGIYPNPASDIIAVNIPDSYQDLRFELYDLDAKIVRTGGVNTDSKIDASTLPNGMYIIRLYEGSTDLGAQKVIILR